jgi:diguanylate cyclase (GGDEF)-like protein
MKNFDKYLKQNPELSKYVKKLEEANRQLTKKNAELEELAGKDHLTQLLNNLTFDDFLKREYERAERGGHLGIIGADVDHFKDYNDTYGHPKGDLALKRVADFLGKSIRPTDRAYRKGGEEFVIFLPGDDLDATYGTAERIRKGIEEYSGNLAESGKLPKQFTLSFGVVSSPETPSNDAYDLIIRLDKALYASKHNGRNKVTVFQ